ncbi:hypothetical protein NDU88_002973 [Pleurodeles waltl]|uniref:Uncharacterized protein n=1 Tax=Pleurodeles waltl TaxID=8319 RepID=A0AAV7MX77_PLEWA|nr:hypothetical protein NDU88_002973 [Pleurodeles waltl]
MAILSWGTLRPVIPNWYLQTEALLDPPFHDALLQCIRHFFETNNGSASSRAVEWKAHKVVNWGHCIATTWGVRRLLIRDLSEVEPDLRQPEVQVTGHTMSPSRFENIVFICLTI